MPNLGSDIRLAFRGFAKSPLFTGVAVASLALGLGANTAIFGLLDQVLMRPLPVKAPSQLVLLTNPGPNNGRFSGDNSDRLFSYPMYLELRDRNEVFDGVMARFPRAVNLSQGGQSQHAECEVVSGNYFDVLGVKAAAGRLLTAADDVKKGQHPLVVLGHGFWLSRFGGKTSVVGQVVRVNSTMMTVIGVAPREFFGVHIGAVPDLYVPLTMKKEVTPTWDMLEERKAHFLHVLARMKAGMTLPRAQAGLQPMFKTLLEADLAAMPAGQTSERFVKRFMAKALLLQPAHNGVPTFREEGETPLQVLMAMVGLVLLIACANVANLLVARALGRQREVAIRLSMGASRAMLVRQFVVESVMLSLLGGAAGLVVAAWTGDLLIASIPQSGALTSSLDPRMIAFCGLLSLATGALFGLIPALQATRPDVNAVLKDQAGGVIGGFGTIRSRQALVVAQVALSLLLLVGAGLFARSLINLRRLDPGFLTGNQVMFSVDGASNGYSTERTLRTYESIQERLRTIAGVKAATGSDMVLLSGDQSSSTVHVAGYTSKQDEDMNPKFLTVLPGFFETMGVPLVAGRDFNSLDRGEKRKVAIVNETFSKYFFGNESPIGHRFGTGRDTEPTDIEIIGVVKDGKYNSLRNEKLRVIYVPILQDDRPGHIAFTARTAGPPEAAMAAIRKAVAEVDPTLAMWDFKTMETQVSESLFVERMVATLCACFGLLATVLASVGLYGVMSYSVARRTREIGIRIALGAGRNSVLGLVLREVVVLCAAGLIVGVPVAIALSRYVRSQLYGVTPNDPLTLVAASLVLATVAFVSGLIPARRAAAVDPMVALRYE